MNRSQLASVSVVIPAYNAERWIVETLNSVVAQDLPDIEIVVVDDGSTDGTAELVKSHFANVKLIQSRNCGASHARNLGTAATTGKYIQYLDADDLLCPSKIVMQVTALERTGFDIAYGDWQYLTVNVSGQFIPDTPIRQQMTDDPELALMVDFFCASNAYLFRRDIIAKVGGWNEDIYIIQDVRLVQDCARHRAKFLYCPGSMSQYRKYGSNSLSTGNPRAFALDCIKNAVDAEAWWQAHGGLTQMRREVLILAYHYIARSSFEKDPTVFEIAYNNLTRLSPRGKYLPKSPKSLHIASQVLGYYNAEKIAGIYRRAKKTFHLARNV